MTLLPRNDVSYSQAVQHPKAEGYNFLIGGRWWRTAAAPGIEIQIGSRDSLAQRQDQAGSIYENVLDLGYAWARTDMSGGEGLDWDPPEIPRQTALSANDPRRYWDSENIDVERPAAGERYELKLARQFVEWNSSITPVTTIAASSAFIFVGDGDTIRWYDTWDNTVEEGSYQPLAATDVIKVVATPDDRCVALLANGDLWNRDAGGATFAKLYDSTLGSHGDFQDVWYAKGRFLAWDSDGDLLEVPYDGTAVVVVEAMQTSLTIHSVVESGPCVVAAVSDGTIRTYNSVVAGGIPELTPAARTEVPKGEIPVLVGSNAGRMLYLTRNSDGNVIRLYQGTVLDDRYDYIVGEIQLRREWFSTTEVINIASNMHSTRDTVLFSIDEAGGSAVWRYDLVTQGLTRYVRPFTSGLTSTVIEFDGRIAVISTSTDTIYLESDTLYTPDGYLITPNITFGLNTDIAWLASVVEAANLTDSGIQVEVLRTTDPTAILDKDHASWITMHTLSSQASSGLENALVGIKSRTIALQLRLFSTAADTVTPTVTRMAVRGIPTHRDMILVVPVNVSDWVSAPGRKPYRVVGLGNELQQDLLSLLGENVEARVLNPTVTVRGIVNNISEPIQYVSKRGSVSRYCLVEIRGQRLTGSTVSQGEGGMGMALMGIGQMGIGD